MKNSMKVPSQTNRTISLLLITNFGEPCSPFDRVFFDQNTSSTYRATVEYHQSSRDRKGEAKSFRHCFSRSFIPVGYCIFPSERTTFEGSILQKRKAYLTNSSAVPHFVASMSAKTIIIGATTAFLLSQCVQRENG
jgi:hypothetical protein